MNKLLGALTILLAVSACSCQFKSIFSVVESDPNFSTLTKLLRATQLSYTLSQLGPYTLFAPNNTAFAALPSSFVNYLVDPNNINILKSVLLYHVVSGAVRSGDLQNGQTLTTAQGQSLAVTVRTVLPYQVPLIVSINTARVVKADVTASNGYIHAIDSVLLTDAWSLQGPYLSIYAQLSADPSLTTLAYAMQVTGLDRVLSDSSSGAQFTLFAPTNTAFLDPVLAPLFQPENRGALKQVLLYHVLRGAVFSTGLYDGLNATTLNSAAPALNIRRTQVYQSLATVNDANILKTDSYSFNGVWHTIDRVLLPSSF